VNIPLSIGAVCLFAFAVPVRLMSQSDTSGERASKEELVEQANAETAEIDDSLLPEGEESPSARADVRSRFAACLQPALGFQSGRYAGSPVKSYQRVRWFLEKRARGGLLIEKDPGEARLDDFVCGHIELLGLGPLVRCVAGDFSIESGRGALFGRPMGMGNGTLVLLPAKREPEGLKPYLSSSEDGFFRGLAAEFRAGAFHNVLFCSWRDRSATVDENARVTSFSSSGYFRTDAEIAKRGNIKEQCLGGTLLFRPGRGFSVGISFLSSVFSRPLALSLLELDQGEPRRVATCTIRWSLGPAGLFGEWAVARGGSEGVGGLVLSPAPELCVLASLRSSPKGFASLHGLWNMERGEYDLYLACRARTSPSFSVSAFWDLSEKGAQPGKLLRAQGTDALIEAEARLVRGLGIKALYRRRTTPVAGKSVNTIGLVSAASLTSLLENYRLSAGDTLSEKLEISGKLEFLTLEEGPPSPFQKGYAFSGSILYRPGAGVHMECGLACFRSDGTGSGARVYEPDLPGSSMVNVLWGSGARIFLLIRYRPSKLVEFSVKYSDLVRDDVQRIGSGLEELPGDRATAVAVQCDLSI
jgi:hypothetical protein